MKKDRTASVKVWIRI